MAMRTSRPVTGLTPLIVGTVLTLACIAMVVSTVNAYGGNVYCHDPGYSLEGTHGVAVDGVTGFEDFLARPVNVEIDWDDGTGGSDNVSSSYEFHHAYSTGGLRHIKVYTEGADGGHCSEDNGATSPVVIDVWVP